jgi:hypothetical protein
VGLGLLDARFGRTGRGEGVGGMVGVSMVRPWMCNGKVGSLLEMSYQVPEKGSEVESVEEELVAGSTVECCWSGWSGWAL